MSIAFLILAHKNPAQVALLIKSLIDMNFRVFVHVDLKSNIQDYIEEAQKISKTNNVVWCRRRYNVTIGQFSLVEATLSSLEEILNYKEIYYTILLSGQDLPIRTKSFIRDFFLKNRNSILIEYFKIPSQNLFDGGIIRFPSFEEIDPKIPLYAGSSWWSAPNIFLSEVMDFINLNPLLKLYFQKVDIPEESFFQTIFLNLENNFDVNLINDNYRLILWDKNAPHPKILTQSEMSKIKNSSAILARKFDINIDSNIIFNLIRK